MRGRSLLPLDGNLMPPDRLPGLLPSVYDTGPVRHSGLAAIAAMRGAQKLADALRDHRRRDRWRNMATACLRITLRRSGSADDVMQAVNASKSDSERRERLCEAGYFLAQLRRRR